MKLFFVAFLAVVAMCKLGTLVHDKMTVDSYKCLLNSKHEFTAIRALTSDGKVDDNLIVNLKNAKDAGLKDIDVYISPCLPCEPEDQIAAVVNALKGQQYGKIYINIDVPGWREFKNFNQMFLEDVINGLTKAGIKFGVLSTKAQWEEYFGPDYSHASRFPLMYESLNKDPSFKDFKPFGGWRKPAAKFFQADASICSLKLDLAYAE